MEGVLRTLRSPFHVKPIHHHIFTKLGVEQPCLAVVEPECTVSKANCKILSWFTHCLIFSFAFVPATRSMSSRDRYGRGTQWAKQGMKSELGYTVQVLMFSYMFASCNTDQPVSII
jgi:hypothetical protein